MNTVNILGRITQDITLKVGKTGKPYMFNVLAVNKYVGGEKKADFIPIMAFGKTAENIEKYSQKGGRVSIVGNIQSSSFEKDGEMQHSLQVVIEKIDFIDFRKTENDVIDMEKILEQYNDVPF